MKLKFEITHNELIVYGLECWSCEKTINITSHHVIPKYLLPKRNVQIPLCEECHKKLHGNDMNVLQAFAYKIWKSLKEGVQQISALQSLISRKQKEAEKDERS